MACRVVGGGTALDIHRAVLYQRDAVLRGHRLVLDLKLATHRFFQIGQNALTDLDVITRVFAVTQRVGQSARRVADPHGDDARVLGLGQCVGLSGHTDQGRESKCKQFGVHECGGPKKWKNKPPRAVGLCENEPIVSQISPGFLRWRVSDGGQKNAPASGRQNPESGNCSQPGNDCWRRPPRRRSFIVLYINTVLLRRAVRDPELNAGSDRLPLTP